MSNARDVYCRRLKALGFSNAQARENWRLGVPLHDIAGTPEYNFKAQSDFVQMVHDANQQRETAPEAAAAILPTMTGELRPGDLKVIPFDELAPDAFDPVEAAKVLAPLVGFDPYIRTPRWWLYGYMAALAAMIVVALRLAGLL